MKEFITKEGGRRIFNDDLINLQDLASATAQLLVGFGGSFVLSGGVRTVSGATATISAGYAWLGGKVRKFEAFSYPSSTTKKVAMVAKDGDGPTIIYADGSTGAEYTDYAAEIKLYDSYPSGDYIAFGPDAPTFRTKMYDLVVHDNGSDLLSSIAQYIANNYASILGEKANSYLVDNLPDAVCTAVMMYIAASPSDDFITMINDNVDNDKVMGYIAEKPSTEFIKMINSKLDGDSITSVLKPNVPFNTLVRNIAKKANTYTLFIGKLHITPHFYGTSDNEFTDGTMTKKWDWARSLDDTIPAILNDETTINEDGSQDTSFDVNTTSIELPSSGEWSGLSIDNEHLMISILGEGYPHQPYSDRTELSRISSELSGNVINIKHGRRLAREYNKGWYGLMDFPVMVQIDYWPD